VAAAAARNAIMSRSFCESARVCARYKWLVDDISLITDRVSGRRANAIGRVRPSVHFHTKVSNLLTFDLDFACVWVMVIARRRSKIKVTG